MEKNESTVCTRSFDPTRVGYRILSIVPTATMPHPTRMQALIQLPVANRNRATGPQTRNVPPTGISATMKVADAHSTGAGTPSAEYITPASTDCTKATVSDPFTVA